MRRAAAAVRRAVVPGELSSRGAWWARGRDGFADSGGKCGNPAVLSGARLNFPGDRSCGGVGAPLQGFGATGGPFPGRCPGLRLGRTVGAGNRLRRCGAIGGAVNAGLVVAATLPANHADPTGCFRLAERPLLRARERRRMGSDAGRVEHGTRHSSRCHPPGFVGLMIYVWGQVTFTLRANPARTLPRALASLAAVAPYISLLYCFCYCGVFALISLFTGFAVTKLLYGLLFCVVGYHGLRSLWLLTEISKGILSGKLQCQPSPEEG